MEGSMDPFAKMGPYCPPMGLYCPPEWGYIALPGEKMGPCYPHIFLGRGIWTRSGVWTHLLLFAFPPPGDKMGPYCPPGDDAL